MNRWVRSFVCLPLVAVFSSSIQAQDVLEDLYGSGVHAYFAGNTTLAEERFSEAINAGSQDPRVYYFRGLSQIRSQGVMDAGIADFEQGAQLEVLGRRSSDVARSLQRIQGPSRIAIERARTQARLASKSAQFELMRKRYEAAATGGVMPSGPAVESNKNPAANPTDPFAGEGKPLEGAAEEMPAVPEPGTKNSEPAPGADPFADDAPTAPATPPASDDPFSDSATPTAPAAETENPFGF